MSDDSQLIKREIIAAPDHFFGAQHKTLDARLEGIQLDPAEAEKIIAERTKKVIRDKALGFFKIGDVINTILNWNDQVDADLKNAKKEYLLSHYFEKSESHGNALESLKGFVTNPQGNTLFNKVLRILDASPPDKDLAHHLSAAIRKMVDSDFVKLFEAHRFALGQIEQLTPQALSILGDQRHWPPIILTSYQSSGSRIVSDWLSEFAQPYAKVRGVENNAIINRIKHATNELITGRLIEAHTTGKGVRCVVTEIGKTLSAYIEIN